MIKGILRQKKKEETKVAKKNARKIGRVLRGGGKKKKECFDCYI